MFGGLIDLSPPLSTLGIPCHVPNLIREVLPSEYSDTIFTAAALHHQTHLSQNFEYCVVLQIETFGILFGRQLTKSKKCATICFVLQVA